MYHKFREDLKERHNVVSALINTRITISKAGTVKGITLRITAKGGSFKAKVNSAYNITVNRVDTPLPARVKREVREVRNTIGDAWVRLLKELFDGELPDQSPNHWQLGSLMSDNEDE